jgi:hypothetical protein
MPRALLSNILGGKFEAFLISAKLNSPDDFYWEEFHIFSAHASRISVMGAAAAAAPPFFYFYCPLIDIVHP